MSDSINRLTITKTYSPSLRSLPQWCRQGADAWRLSTWNEDDERLPQPERLAEIVAESWTRCLGGLTGGTTTSLIVIQWRSAVPDEAATKPQRQRSTHTQ